MKSNFLNIKDTSFDSFTYGLYIFAFFLPIGFYKITRYTIALLVLFWVFRKGWKNVNSLHSKAIKPVIFYFLLYIVSLVYSKNLARGIIEIEQHLALVFIPLIIILSPAFDKRTQLNIKLIFSISIFIFIFIADLFAIIDSTKSTLIYFNESYHSKYFSYGLTRIFDNWHPTYVSLTLILAISFLEEIKINKFLKVLLYLLAIMNIYLLQSLTGYISLAAYMLYIIYKKNKILSFIIPLFILLFAYINPFNINKIERIKKTGKISVSDKKNVRNSLSIRLAKWDTTISIINSNRYIGVSPGDLDKHLLNSYIKKRYFFCAEKIFSPHNEFLFIMSSFGILGFFIFLWAFLQPILINATKESIFYVIIFSIFFLTEDILEREQGLFLWVFFYSLLINKQLK